MEILKDQDQDQAEGTMVFFVLVTQAGWQKLRGVAPAYILYYIYPILVRNQFCRYLQIIWVYHFQRSIVVNHDNTDFASEQSKL